MLNTCLIWLAGLVTMAIFGLRPVEVKKNAGNVHSCVKSHIRRGIFVKYINYDLLCVENTQGQKGSVNAVTTWRGHEVSKRRAARAI